MFLIIPLMSFILIYLSIYIKSGKDNSLICWRRPFLSASIIIGLLLLVITELLSIFNSITLNWLLISWGAALFVSFSAYIFFVSRLKPVFQFKVPGLSRFDISLLFSITLIAGVIGLIAFIAPPNSWDSMTYHMSRVMHWIQNHNLKHYPTHISRQLHQNPWSEFTIMHLQILSGTDRFANLVQWLSMIGSLLGVSLIAKLLGANSRGQIFAAVIAATIPVGILQASSTLNDYVVCFWIVCFVYYLMLMQKYPAGLYLSAASASLGLAILTKATAYIYAFPFLAGFVFSELKTLRLMRLVKFLSIMLFIIFIINFGHYRRNFQLYGHPLGPCQEEHANNCKYRNEVFTLSSLISNIIRNISLHIQIPFTGARKSNPLAEKNIKSIHDFLGIAINDPRTTWPEKKFTVKRFSLYENDSANFLHLILIIGCSIIFLLPGGRGNKRNLLNYLINLALVFLLFCFYLKWQPWHSRLHLPLFMLWSAFIGIILSGIANHKVANSIIIMLIVSSLPWLFQNKTRKLFGENNIFHTARIDQYFSGRRYLKVPYVEATNYIKLKGYSDIGLYMGPNDWEYPFWVLLKNNDSRRLRIEHIGVKNQSAIIYPTYHFCNFIPDAIISLDEGKEKKEMAINGRSYAQGYIKEYTREEKTYSVNVFVRK